ALSAWSVRRSASRNRSRCTTSSLAYSSIGTPLDCLSKMVISTSRTLPCAAHTTLDSEVLHRLHEQHHALDLRQRRLQPPDDLAGAHLPLGQGFEVDEDAPAVERGVGAVDTDERRQARDGRILEDHR